MNNIKQSINQIKIISTTIKAENEQFLKWVKNRILLHENDYEQILHQVLHLEVN